MSQEGQSCPVVSRALTTGRSKVRGKRRGSHFSNPKQLKAQKLRREKKAKVHIVDQDCTSDDSGRLKVRDLGAILKVFLL